MLNKTISELEERVEKADSISGEERSALLKLIGELKVEITALSKTHAEEANSIAGFTQIATHEAMRQERNAGLFEIAQEGLEKSVEEFELTHPTLVNTIREISDVLSNLGI
jgi:signal transduction histidine kinase